MSTRIGYSSNAFYCNYINDTTRLLSRNALRTFCSGPVAMHHLDTAFPVRSRPYGCARRCPPGLAELARGFLLSALRLLRMDAGAL